MRLLILGAGEYGMLVREIAQAMGIFKEIDFLDDENEVAIGRINEYIKFAKDYTYAVVAVGNSEFRLKYIEKLSSYYKIATIIHPRAHISPSAQIKQGCVIEVGAVISTAVIIGIGCLVCAGVIVNHDSVVNNGCHLDCGSIVTSHCVVPMSTKLDCGRVFSGRCDTLPSGSSSVVINSRFEIDTKEEKTRNIF